MKIAIYQNSPGGGAKRALYYFAKELSRKHTLEEFTLSTANPFLPLKPVVKESHVYDIPKVMVVRLKPYILDCARELVEFHLVNRHHDEICAKIASDINSSGFDVALVDICIFAHAPHILKYLKVPAVYYCHDPFRALYEKNHFFDYNLNKKNFLRKIYSELCEKVLFLQEQCRGRIDKENCLSANLIVTNSYYTREYIHKVYARAVDVNYLGVDTVLFRKVKTQKENFIISVGRLYREKGHDFIIRALSRLDVARRPKLIIVGDKSDSDERKRIEDLALKRGVEIQIREMVSDEELVDLYNRAMIAVFVPFMEPFGFVPLEAMACGTAVIGIREGGVRESIIHQETGLLIDRSEEDLARAMGILLNDDALRQRLEHQASAYVQAKWTWSIAAENLEKRLIELAKKGNYDQTRP